jgi:Predicted secreted protein (DUF2259)
VDANVFDDEVKGPKFGYGDTEEKATEQALKAIGKENLKDRGFDGQFRDLVGSQKAHSLELEVRGSKALFALREIPAPRDQDCPGAPSDLRMFALDADYGGQPSTVQSDRRLPSNRKCAAGYKIHGGFVRDNRFAIVIEVLGSGGPMTESNRFTVTTGVFR